MRSSEQFLDGPLSLRVGRFFFAGTWSLVFGVRVSYVMQIHADHDEAK